MELRQTPTNSVSYERDVIVMDELGTLLQTVDSFNDTISILFSFQNLAEKILEFDFLHFW